MVSVLRILHRPCHPGPLVTFPIRTHHGHQNFYPRVCHRSRVASYFLIAEQNRREVYREVLIAGDVSKEDVDRATAQISVWEVSRL